ncbi:MAG: HypC/HybG/HupF family hydrogenase formation chaperone [Deltaproteobacteria bacterium]|nr:HypC/HybG/HupF family hydrogenase formation chaperone [Deltaproteobacteria bacterium]
MCLAIPMKLVARDGQDGTAEISGVTRKVLLDLLPDAVVGDYLIVHAGYAIQRLDEAEASVILETLGEYFAAAEAEGSAI